MFFYQIQYQKKVYFQKKKFLKNDRQQITHCDGLFFHVGGFQAFFFLKKNVGNLLP